MKKIVGLGLVLIAVFASTAQAAPGDLDPSFGQGGSVRFFPNDEGPSLGAVAVQPDDKVVLAGADQTVNGVLVVRLLADGAFDPSFGSGGVVTTPFPGGFGGADAVTVQPDGKIVVVGAAKGTVESDFLIARYLSGGAPDPSFGGGDGIEILPIKAGMQDRAEAIALGAGGRILVAGTTSSMAGSEVAVAVLEPGGKPDPAFSTDGITTLVTADKDDRGAAIAEGPGGTIIVGDANAAGGGKGITVFRLLPNGTPDPAFGTGGGYVTTPIPGTGGSGGRIRDLAVLGDGRIVAAGYGQDEIAKVGDEKFAAVRYLPDGKPDPSFGVAGTGIFEHQVGVGSDGATSIAITSSGKTILAGSWEPSKAGGAPALIRLDSAGAFDPTFGSGGLALRPELAPFGDFLEDAALDSRERVVTVSRPYLGNNVTATEVTRFLGDIPPDPPPAQIGPPAPPAKSNRPPTVKIKSIPKQLAVDKLKGFSGTAADPDGDGLAKVQIALTRKVGAGPKAKATPSAVKAKGAKRTCLSLRNAKGGFKTSKVKKPKPCPHLWLTAKGTGKWSFKLAATLPPGRYVLAARAVDAKGAAAATFSRAAGNRVAFKLLAK